ncbi:MAG: SMI1/KNR4 family protein [Chloroflexi bacterium]|nr:MAG: SMI1/KNR4 family protein [Chloroflexota bacterium]
MLRAGHLEVNIQATIETLVADSFRSIDDGLMRLRRNTTLRLLRRGVDRHHCETALNRMKLLVPAGLAGTYQWHDGTDTSTGVTLDDLHLFPGFYFLSLDDAIKNYEAFRQDSRWNPAWLPLFANGGGDFYAVVCRERDVDWGRVVHFRIDEANHPVEFSSLSTFLATIAAGYDSSLFFVDSRGYLEMDDMAWVALAARLNPDVAYWHIE